MKTYRWAKLWIDILDDWKWGTLPDSSKVRFIECMLVAKEYNAGGVLPPLREMAYRLRIDTDTLTADLMRLAQNELVELTDYNGEERWWMPNFEKRQETPMTSTERVQAFRERERLETLRGDNETSMKRRVSQEVEVEVEEEAEVEQKQKQNGANAPDAAAAFMELWGFFDSPQARQLAAMDLPSDYIQAHLDYAKRNGERTGLAIRRMIDGDPAPGKTQVCRQCGGAHDETACNYELVDGVLRWR